MYSQKIHRSLSVLQKELHTFYVEYLQFPPLDVMEEMPQSWRKSMDALYDANRALDDAINAERTAEAVYENLEPALADQLRTLQDEASVNKVALVDQAYHAVIAALDVMSQAVEKALTAANSAVQISKAIASLSTQPEIVDRLEILTKPLNEINEDHYEQHVAQPSPVEALQNMDNGAVLVSESAASAQEQTVPSQETRPSDDAALAPISASVPSAAFALPEDYFSLQSSGELRKHGEAEICEMEPSIDGWDLDDSEYAEAGGQDSATCVGVASCDDVSQAT